MWQFARIWWRCYFSLICICLLQNLTLQNRKLFINLKLLNSPLCLCQFSLIFSFCHFLDQFGPIPHSPTGTGFSNMRSWKLAIPHSFSAFSLLVALGSTHHRQSGMPVFVHFCRRNSSMECSFFAAFVLPLPSIFVESPEAVVPFQLPMNLESVLADVVDRLMLKLYSKINSLFHMFSIHLLSS